ncbi:hypothetical protein ABT294_20865 [Nonomuraea sp. NPDC000554]|uniref:hypothetical protein n=1 Tax=Nonomuraea sp. NPDC000554 TaxID=3154259 RepID=UPI00331DA1EA
MDLRMPGVDGIAAIARRPPCSPPGRAPRRARLNPTHRGRPDRRPAASRQPSGQTPRPAPTHKIGALPKICHQRTITLHPGDLGHLDKFRQDLPYLSSSWRGTYSTSGAMTEGLNGRLKGHDLDLSDPKSRLAHGRVAQTILVALLVTVTNDHFLDQWRHTHQPPDKLATSSPASASPCPATRTWTSTSGLTPPGPPQAPPHEPRTRTNPIRNPLKCSVAAKIKRVSSKLE